MNSSHRRPSCQSLLFSHNALLTAVSFSKGSGILRGACHALLLFLHSPMNRWRLYDFPPRSFGNFSPGVWESERQTYGVLSATTFPVSLMHKAFIHLDSPISISERLLWTWGEVRLTSNCTLSLNVKRLGRLMAWGIFYSLRDLFCFIFLPLSKLFRISRGDT